MTRQAVLDAMRAARTPKQARAAMAAAIEWQKRHPSRDLELMGEMEMLHRLATLNGPGAAISRE